MDDKKITLTYFDELDQIKVRSFSGHVGYDIIGDSLVKVWENRETLIIPVDRLVSLVMLG